MLVEWKWCGGFSKDNLKHKFYTDRNFWEEAPLPFPIIYFVPLCEDYIQMSLFPGTPKGSPKTGILAVPNLWTPISFSNKVLF
jgi:hypothetical protein